MRGARDTAVCEKTFTGIKVVLARFEDIKGRIARFPRRPELHTLIFENMNRGGFRQLEKLTKDLEKKAVFLENAIGDLETKFEEFLKTELSS